jgi:hypothetical protein
LWIVVIAFWFSSKKILENVFDLVGADVLVRSLSCSEPLNKGAGRESRKKEQLSGSSHSTQPVLVGASVRAAFEALTGCQLLCGWD